MHSKPLKLSARAWKYYEHVIFHHSFQDRGVQEEAHLNSMHVHTGGKKRVKKGKEKKRYLQTTRQRHVCKCISVDVVPAAFGKVVVWRLCQTEKACVRRKWQRLCAPRTILQHVWAIRVCLAEEKMLCSVRELESWRVRRGKRGDDRVTGWLIICVAHLSPNNTQTLDHRGGIEGDGRTQRDLKSKWETGEGGDR